MNYPFLVFACLCSLLTTTLAEARVDIQHWTTRSGARVYFVASPALPMLDLQIDFSAGSAFESDPQRAGLAELTNDLLASGAQGLDEEQIAARQVDLGARLHSSTDHDRASLSLRTLSAPAERQAAVSLVHALLTTPSFPEAALVRERARSIAAIQEADTRPDALAAKRFAEAIYSGHPYGVQATAASVGAITREDLERFWRKNYGARRAVITLVGDVSRAEAESIATELSDGLPEAEAEPTLAAVRQPQATTLSIAHPAAQSHILLGMPAIRRGDPDFFPLLVGNYVLGGGGFVSRLMQEVREKRGYAYSVYSYFAPRKLEGPFEIGLQTKRSQAAAALEVVHATLAGFLRDGPSAAELKAAKQNLIDGQALRLDSNAKLLASAALIGFYGLPLDYLDRFPARVEAVSAVHVKQAFARHVKPENLVTVIVAGDAAAAAPAQ